MKKMKEKKVEVIKEKGDYGKGIEDELKEEIKKGGIKEVNYD